MQVRINMYLSSFPRHCQCLNLSANIGISDTSNQELIQMPTNKSGADHSKASICRLNPNKRAPQKSALAGVGRPIKEVVWRSSRLNLASRSAEKATKTNAKKGSRGDIGVKNEG